MSKIISALTQVAVRDTALTADQLVNLAPSELASQIARAQARADTATTKTRRALAVLELRWLMRQQGRESAI
jgi:hypothetical protein